jgi:hypothetical protein
MDSEELSSGTGGRHLQVLGFGSAIAPETGSTGCSMVPTAGIAEAIDLARSQAWTEAAPFVSSAVPVLRLLGPRVESSDGPVPEIRPSDFLGDCAAAGGALLLAGAWAEFHLREIEGPFELVAVGSSGEAAVLLLGC